jgi:hypothetical protein
VLDGLDDFDIQYLKTNTKKYDSMQENTNVSPRKASRGG